MQQEISKPVAIALVVVAVLLIVGIGWYFLGRPQQYPGYQAPPGMAGSGAPGTMPGQGPGGPGMMPGQAPGQAPGGGPAAAPGGTPYPATGAPR